MKKLLVLFVLVLATGMVSAQPELLPPEDEDDEIEIEDPPTPGDFSEAEDSSEDTDTETSESDTGQTTVNDDGMVDEESSNVVSQIIENFKRTLSLLGM